MEWYLTLLAVYRNKKEVLFNIINREGLKTKLLQFKSNISGKRSFSPVD